jgi:hypothetical protein
MDKCHMENLNARLPHIDQHSKNTSFEIEGTQNDWMIYTNASWTLFWVHLSNSESSSL